MAWFRMMGAESVEYHRETILERGDDHAGRSLAYYGSRGETPLAWGGALAARMGLAGVVDDAAYSAVFGAGGAHDPGSGERLVSVTRPGVELVVSAHKSVAVLGVIGRAEDMHAILDAETDATMAFLDTWFGRQGGRRGREQVRTATGGLLWARTRHATSRAGDPNPHDHVLVANVTRMLDERGGWKALDTGGLRDLVHAATMAGRLAAAATAVELGYGIAPDAGPSGRLDHWRIDGIPDEILEVFSKRSADIHDAMDAVGLDSHRARGVAARTTRHAKADDSIDSLTERWLGELEGIGWDAARLTQAIDGHSPGRLRTLDKVEHQAMVWELVGPDGPLAERKAFTRADVIRVAAPRLYGYRPDELDRVVADVLAHSETIPLLGQPGARGRAWAAASVIAREQAIANVASRMCSRERSRVAPPAVTVGTLRAALAAKEQSLGSRLTAGQRHAAEVIATGGNRLDLVVGVAGSGKTTALEVARAAFETGGYCVLGAATSGQAARTLQAEAGVESRTIASLVWRLEHETLRLDDRTVVFVDEAGMTSDTDLLKLLVAAEAAGSKLVAIGDHHQLGAVASGGGLEALTRRHPGNVHALDRNIRQTNRAESIALAALRAGDVAFAVDWYADNDRLRTAPTRTESLDEAVDAWAADRATGRNTVLMAWRRRDVAALNARARARLQASGQVSRDEIEVAPGRCYAAGDRVVHLAPSGDGRYVTSQRGPGTSIDADAAVVRYDDGTYDVLGHDELAPDRLDHAYAVTVHRMQGATVETAHVYADGGGRELAYVAMSRARERTAIYTTADTPELGAKDLRREWSANAREQWVLDTDHVLDRSAHPRPELQTLVDRTLELAAIRVERDALIAATTPEHRRIAAIDNQISLKALTTTPPAPGLGLSR